MSYWSKVLKDVAYLNISYLMQWIFKSDLSVQILWCNYIFKNVMITDTIEHSTMV